jgi:hypothetical protein
MWLSSLASVLSVDIMDISGESQFNIMHELERMRIHADGRPVDQGGAKGLKGEADRLASLHGKDYCGSCYGGEPPQSGCCNTCDEVREAYVAKGWSFSDPDHIDQVRISGKRVVEIKTSNVLTDKCPLLLLSTQCVSEGWSQKIKEQNTEGCNVAGRVHVNKVIGNFHISPGRAFQRNSVHVHDLVPYLAGSGSEHHVSSRCF